MATDPNEIYLQLTKLIEEMPDLTVRPLQQETYAWTGRAAYWVQQALGEISMENITFKHAVEGLDSTVLAPRYAHQIQTILHRALARAESNAPVAVPDAFVPVASPVDAMKAIGKILNSASTDCLIVDAYLDAQAIMEFAPLANEGVMLRLMADRERRKPVELAPVMERWKGQFGVARPIECRLAKRRSLHDRLIIVDRSKVWSITQSLKDFAKTSPASVMSVEIGLASSKIEFYESLWTEAVDLATE